MNETIHFFANIESSQFFSQGLRKLCPKSPLRVTAGSGIGDGCTTTRQWWAAGDRVLGGSAGRVVEALRLAYSTRCKRHAGVLGGLGPSHRPV